MWNHPHRTTETRNNSPHNQMCRAAPGLGLGRHVGADVDGLGQLRDGDLEARLDVLEGLGVLVVGDEGDGEALGAEAAGAADAVQVGVAHLGHVVVDDDVDALDVDAAAPDVRRDEDTVLEVLEGLVERDALRLLDARVDGHRGEVALLQQLVELDGALHALDEDDHLVELERVEQLVELAVLLVLRELDVVLLQTW